MNALKKVSNIFLVLIIIFICGLYYINKNPLSININFNISNNINVSSDKILITYSDFKIKISSKNIIISKEKHVSFNMVDAILDIDLWLLTSSFSAKFNEAEILPFIDTGYAKHNKIKFDGNIKSRILLLKPKMIEIQLTSNKGYIIPESKNLKEVKLNNFLLSLEYHSNELFIKELKFSYDNGINANLSGNFIIQNNKLSSAIFKSEVNNLPINYLKYLWPEPLFPNIQNWVIAHVSDGVVNKAKGEFNFTQDSLNKDILPKECLYAELDITDAKLNYLSSYSPIHNITGKVIFDGEALNVNANKASFKNIELNNLKLTLLFQNLNLNLKTNFNGEINQFTEFIPDEHSQRIQRYDIDLSQAKGNINGTLLLNLKINNIFQNEDLSFDIQGDISDVSIGESELLKLKKGKIKLIKMPDKAFLSINDNESISVEITDYFGHNSEDENYIEINSSFNIKSSSSLNSFEFKQGTAKVNAQISKKIWQSTIDLTNTEIYATNIGYNKSIKTALVISCKGDIMPDNIASDNCIISGKPDFSGLAKFNYQLTNKKMVQFSIDNAKIGNNQFSFNMDSKNNFNHYNLNAKIIDFKQLNVNDVKFDNKNTENSLFTINIRKLICKNDIILNNVLGSIRTNINTVPDVRFSASSGDNIFTISKAIKNGQNIYSIHSKNFSPFIQAFNFYNNTKKGEAWIEIIPHKTKEGIEYDAKFKLNNFAFTNTSIITKVILGILSPINSLSSIVQSLKGGSLSADSFTGELNFKNSILTMKNGHITESSYAIRLNGYVDLNKKFLKFKGLYIPYMYGINKIVSAIPFLGKLIIGGKDSALIGANFTIRGKMSNPVTNFHPFSLLTPGFLRNIL